MNNDFKKEWFSKSQIDYFSSFIALWLSCNSWYNFHYSLKTDREHVNKIKSDFTNSNKLFKEFDKLFKGAISKEQKSLFTSLEQLHFCLNRINLKPDKMKYHLSFDYILRDFSKKDDLNGYESVIIKNPKTTAGKIKTNVSGVDLGGIVLENNSEKVFAGLFEIIYQVRCSLVHGHLQPTEDNHEIIKYCYFILNDLMKPFCV